MPSRPQNLLLFSVDSLRADHVSAYGYPRLTTPHLDRYAASGVLFERCFAPHIPTTSAYASMLTGTDCFTNEVVALRHAGPLSARVPTLADLLRGAGYQTSCVGFGGNPANRGFDTYLEFEAWGRWSDRPLRKAERMNAVAVSELERLARDDHPFFLLIRAMEPHSPYLPPEPFASAFYGKDPCDPAVETMRPAWAFRPFRDYFEAWMPPGLTDAEFLVAQYDGALAYLDTAFRALLTRLEELGVAESTLVVINGDHGETLTEHDCYFDHHGLYEQTLHVPLILRHPSLPAGRRVVAPVLHQDLVPTVLEVLGVETGARFDGRSLLPLARGEAGEGTPEFYLTECTWMRKHGWRTPEWKLIVALEPDFHFKPEVELYHLTDDPGETRNLASERPEMVAELRGRMDAWIARREKETGRPNPMFTNPKWHGLEDLDGPFTSSQQAYERLHIGDPAEAARLQARGLDRVAHVPWLLRLAERDPTGVLKRLRGATRRMLNAGRGR